MDTSPADATTTKSWATHFGVPFDITFDTNGALGPYSDPSTFPSQLVIRLSDMTIQWTHNGYVAGALEMAIDTALAQ